MKRMIVCVGFIAGMINIAEAQTKNKTSTKTDSNNGAVKLESNSSYAAKAPSIPHSSYGWGTTPSLSSNYQISDPILRTLNARANGAYSTTNFKDLMGVGRGTYGVANGRLLLHPNGSTTSGGITGSGAVGTGSSPGSYGMHGSASTVNGKSPYSGPSMWGTTGTGIGSDFRMSEKSIRTIPAKKKDQ